MPDFRQLHDEDIHALYAELASQYQIPELKRDDPSIKYGLRNADGTGVIAGVSNIGSVQGYFMEDGVRQPMPGKLYYRGISVEDIVEAHQKAGTFGYEEVAYLLLIGHLPTRDQLQKFNLLLEQARFLPERFQEDNVLHNPSNNVMNQLARCVTDLYAYDDNADDTSMENLTRQSIELIARFPLIAANAYQAKRHYIDGKSLYVHNPKPGLSLAENYLRMLRKDKRYTVEEARLLDLMMILHAEHSSNNSTFVCRAISSSGTDTYSAIAGAIGALKGPLHGGANAKAMEMFRAVRGELGETPSDAALSDYPRRAEGQGGRPDPHGAHRADGHREDHGPPQPPDRHVRQHRHVFRPDLRHARPARGYVHPALRQRPHGRLVRPPHGGARHRQAHHAPGLPRRPDQSPIHPRRREGVSW